jgi:hypothetical protein
MAMHKVVLLLLLAVVSGNAMASWVSVGQTEHETYYVNKATIHKSGNTVTMWSLIDYKAAQHTSNGELYLSSKAQTKYDCEESRMRILNAIWSAGYMGTKNAVMSRSNKSEEWIPVAPDSPDALLRTIACSKE